jgi:hypothetical protein
MYGTSKQCNDKNTYHYHFIICYLFFKFQSYLINSTPETNHEAKLLIVISIYQLSYLFLVSTVQIVYTYVIVSNIVLCKPHYVDCLIKELGIDNSPGNPTYTPTLTKEEILDNHRSVLCSFAISTKVEELDLPSLYWIPKVDKCHFKQRYIVGSAKYSTKSLYKLLTCILSAVKTGLYNYCDTSYSRGGVNQMWILKNSKDLSVKSTYNLGPSPPAKALKHLNHLPSTQLFLIISSRTT